jgi:hypothetical protein
LVAQNKNEEEEKKSRKQDEGKMVKEDEHS